MEAREEHFRKVLNVEVAFKNIEATTPGLGHKEITPFTKYEVHEAMKTLENKKVPGPDGICNEHIKASSETHLPIITDLMNLCIKECNIPTTWRLATVEVLYKGKSNQSDTNSYS